MLPFSLEVTRTLPMLSPLAAGKQALTRRTKQCAVNELGSRYVARQAVAGGFALLVVETMLLVLAWSMLSLPHPRTIKNIKTIK